MSERLFFQVNRPYAVDEHACLRYGEGWQKTLQPCQPIQDESLCIGMLGNKNLQLHRLIIQDYDRAPILVVVNAESGETIALNYPGKSTFVLLVPNACDKTFIQNRTHEMFKRDSDRGDHVHVISVQKLLEAGWVPFYAPIQLNKLFDHVRLVFGRTVTQGDEPTMEDAENLKAIFELVPNLHG
jgi:hypothetical protein